MGALLVVIRRGVQHPTLLAGMRKSSSLPFREGLGVGSLCLETLGADGGDDVLDAQFVEAVLFDVLSSLLFDGGFLLGVFVDTMVAFHFGDAPSDQCNADEHGDGD